MRRGQRGFTLTEVLIVLLIVTLLTAILLPVFAKARRSSSVDVSILRMRQMYDSLELYIQSADGSPDVFSGSDAYYHLGLPPGSFAWQTGPNSFNFSPSFWQSPCGFDQTIASSPPSHVPGWISYVAGYYAPEALRDGPANNFLYGDYLQTYQQNAVVFIDPYCNEPNTIMADPYTTKHGLAMTLAGQIINRHRVGDASILQFYSDPAVK